MSVSKLQPPPPRAAPIFVPTPTVQRGPPSVDPRTGPAPRVTVGDQVKDPVFSQVWSGWFRKLAQTVNGNLAAGFTGTVVLAKITGTGANGSLTVVNGIITAYTAPT
jgi:hypothetical protein